MEDLVAFISRFYVSVVKDIRFVHQPNEGSRTGFELEMRISAGADNGCELLFAPAPSIDISGGTCQEVPDFFGETYRKYSNRIEYEIKGKGDSLQVTGPLLNREKYPAVFPIVEGMHKILTKRVGLNAREGEENMLYGKTS